MKEGLKDMDQMEFFKNDIGLLVDFFDGGDSFNLGNEKLGTFCFNPSHEMERIEDTTLTGKNNRDDDSLAVA